MVPLNFICFIVLVHTIADFAVQTRWMAENKSKSIKALTAHIITYFITICLALMLISTYRASSDDLRWAVFSDMYYCSIKYALFNALLHFIIDFMTSRLTSYFWSKTNRYAFFLTIGFDQAAHVITLMTTYWMLNVNTF